ncbi:MAG: DUF3078 domain-containing protein [Candidatus Latescibacterota bacterium]
MTRWGYTLLMAALAGTPAVVYAEPWALTIGSSITLNQSAYSDNWAGNESGNVTWTLMSTSTAKKPLSRKVTNTNTLKLYFGQTRTQNEATNDWGSPEKSTDLIELESVFRFTLGKFLDPFASVRVETFFTDLRDSTETLYVNPVTFTESFGVARAFIKQEHREWTARLGLGVREHIDRNILDPVTLTRSTETTTDGGIEFVNDFRSPLAGDRITVLSKLIVFQALANSRADELRDLPGGNFWKTADVNWENIFTANITKYLIVNLYTQLLYDKEISRGGRFKQTLGLGLAYNIVK